MEAKQKKQMDLLTAIEQIVEKARDSKLSPEFYRKASRYIKYVSDKLDLTKEQSVMLALCIDNSDDSFQFSEFGRYLNCRTSRLLHYLNDMEELERREFVFCNHDERRRTYRVPMEVIDAIKNDMAYEPKDYSGLSPREMFSVLEEIFDKRSEEELSFCNMQLKIKRLIDSNPDLIYVQKLKSYGFAEDDELLLILFSHLFVNNNDDYVGYHNLSFMYGREERSKWKVEKSLLNDGEHPLQDSKMIEFNNDDGFVNRESFRMTRQAKTELFSELNLSSLNKNRTNRSAISWKNIADKKMYYPQGVQTQVSELCMLLLEDNYKAIRHRLKESSFRCGFTCLFYGGPGTGKTETVLQLARLTGRDVIQLNMASIKSMWVGESEKNIKMIFEEYHQKVKESDITPILLFNEADAIIGKRLEGAERAVDKMENSIQNIILQEMENLDGIMIATTNLAQNMDKAFERRFLYKIKFEKPTLEARMHIWHEMIPTLSEPDTKTLAERYDFSGGQIENIARHNAINGILYGDKGNTLEALMSYCDSERLETKQTRKIGF